MQECLLKNIMIKMYSACLNFLSANLAFTVIVLTVIVPTVIVPV